MKAIMQIIREWLSGHKTGVKERAMQALQAEAVRLINLQEVTVVADGSVKYGLFLSGNLVALYDAPTEEVLARLLELRKMYVDFWGPDKVYQA